MLDAFLKDLEAGAVEARGWPAEFSAYKVAKAAMNAYSRVLARRHPALRVNVVDPGYVRTDMTRNSGLLAPDEGGARVVAVAAWRCYRKAARPARSLAAARRRRPRSCDRRCLGAARLVPLRPRSRPHTVS